MFRVNFNVPDQFHSDQYQHMSFMALYYLHQKIPFNPTVFLQNCVIHNIFVLNFLYNNSGIKCFRPCDLAHYG